MCYRCRYGASGNLSARSEQEIAFAGLSLVKNCVRDQRPPQGGMNVVGNGLMVAVSARNPRVDCYGSVGPSSILESCRSILPTMRRSYDEDRSERKARRLNYPVRSSQVRRTLFERRWLLRLS